MGKWNAHYQLVINRRQPVLWPIPENNGATVLHKRFRALYGFLAKKKNRVHPVHVFPTRKQKAAQELSSSINQNLWPRGFWWASVISSARRKRGNGIGDEATGFFVCIFTEPFPQSWISSNIFPACDRVTRSNFYSNDLVVDWPATWNL